MKNDVRELAKLLGISRNRTYTLIGRGDVPTQFIIRLGSRILFNRKAVLQWLGIDDPANGSPARAGRRRTKSRSRSSQSRVTN